MYLWSIVSQQQTFKKFKNFVGWLYSMTFTEILFYLALALGIIIFLRLSSRILLLNRIFIAAITTIVLFLIFLFLSTLIALILVIFIIVFIVSILRNSKLKNNR